MKTIVNKCDLVSLTGCLILIVLIFIPFHAFLTVWASAIFGHYTFIRLWKEAILLLCLIVCIYLFFADKKLRRSVLGSKLFFLIVAYLAVQVIWGLVAYAHHDLSKKALLYGLLLNCRFLIFFLVAWAISMKTKLLNNNVINVIIWPATIVIIFGLAQIFVLPKDFLVHFGYGLNTIPAYETINSNSNYLRIESTLRGANPLGAYILIPLSLATVLFFRFKKSWRKLVFIIAGLVVLIFSFSRSAWAGSVVSISFSIFYSVKSRATREKLIIFSVIIVVVLGSLAVIFKNSTRVQNIVLHTQSNSAVKTTSDQGHTSAVKGGLKDIVTNPIGKGPGSAGPASVYNNHPARIAENYYIQIGQETGVIGLALFLVINVYVGIILWRQKQDNLSLALLASFLGIFIINMLSHAWSDDTLAYLWWGLAGIAIGTKTLSSKNSQKSKNQTSA
ncbi:MAG TPA: O-antigen ligase family protein [Candidatus Saccharimonadales bacterium]